MKNTLILLFYVVFAIFVVACSPAEEPVDLPPDGAVRQVAQEDEPIQQEPEAPKPPFEGKIAIISYTITGGGDGSYESAEAVVEKYGMNKVIHVTWPDNFMAEQEQMIKIVTELGADPDVKVIIINSAVPGTNAAVDKLKETRKDIFVVYIAPQEYAAETAQKADMILMPDELAMGPAMVQQAQKLGAKTFVHYSFPHHMDQPLLAARRDLIKETCAELGIKFVDATALDPAYTGFSDADQFILDDVPKIVAKYGQDTAFFATACITQVQLIDSVVETGAIYPQPCHPSPYHGLVLALRQHNKSLRYTEDEILTVKEIIVLERTVLAEKDMLGRVSTWPDESSNLLTAASAEYAIKWINGKVPKEGVDAEVLKQLMEDYAGVEVFLTPFVDGGTYDYYFGSNEPTSETYDNFLLMRMDYITF